MVVCICIKRCFIYSQLDQSAVVASLENNASASNTFQIRVSLSKAPKASTYLNIALQKATNEQ